MIFMIDVFKVLLSSISAELTYYRMRYTICIIFIIYKVLIFLGLGRRILSWSCPKTYGGNVPIYPIRPGIGTSFIRTVLLQAVNN